MSQYMRKGGRRKRGRKENKKNERGGGERAAVSRAKKKKKQIEMRECETPQIGRKEISGSKKLTATKRVRLHLQNERERKKKKEICEPLLALFSLHHILIGNVTN